MHICTYIVCARQAVKCMYIHTYRTYIYTYKTYIHTHIRPPLPLRQPAQQDETINTYIHTYIRPPLPLRLPAQHTPYIHIYIYIYIYVHTYIHTGPRCHCAGQPNITDPTEEWSDSEVCMYECVYVRIRVYLCMYVCM
jgi:hypothetical protein